MSISLEILTPARLVYMGEAESVTLPGGLGEMQILEGHLALASTIRAGEIRITDAKGGHNCFVVSEGFVDVGPDRVTVLAEFAEGEADIDIDEARAAYKAAEEALDALGHVDLEANARQRSALELAHTRIHVYENRKK